MGCQTGLYFSFSSNRILSKILLLTIKSVAVIQLWCSTCESNGDGKLWGAELDFISFSSNGILSKILLLTIKSVAVIQLWCSTCESNEEGKLWGAKLDFIFLSLQIVYCLKYYYLL